MQLMNYTTGARSTVTNCTDGIAKMTTSVAALPGMLMVKKTRAGKTFVFAQSDRRSTKGGRFDIQLTGYAGKTATVVYDSNQKFRASYSALGDTIALNAAGKFSDVFGANDSHYQVKIYRID